MARFFAIAFAVLLLAASAAFAQNVDVVSQVASARLISGAPLSQVIDNVVRLGEFAFVTSGTPLAVFAVNTTQMRTRPVAGSPIQVRNVTVASDSSPSGVAIGDSLYFFGFQTVYRLNVSTVVASGSAAFNASRDVSSFRFQRESGQNPIPTRAFTAQVSGKTYAYFVGSSVNEVLSPPRREIIRLDPTLFNQGVENATKAIRISVLDGLQAVVAGNSGGQSIAILAFSRVDANKTVIAIFDPTTETVTKTFTISDLAVAGRSITYNEVNQTLFVAGQSYSDGGEPYLLRVKLASTVDGADYTICSSNSSCFNSDPVVAGVRVGLFREEVKSADIDISTGVVFVSLWDGLAAGYVVRVNPITMTLNEPTIFFSQGRQNPSVLIVDVPSRFVYAGLELDVVSFRYPTVCPSQCFESLGQGQCVASKCVCSADFNGDACDQRNCVSDCGASLNQGVCNNGRCLCASNFTGENCTVRQCPFNCSGNGVCSTDGSFTCACSRPEFRGEACNLLSFQICPDFNTLESCVSAPGCGWCADINKCSTGNSVGPSNGTCQEWLVGNNREVGTFAVAIIFIIIFGIMVILNMIAAVSVDYKTTFYLEEENMVTVEFLKESYWRDERSAKAWKLFDQLQFISYYSLIGVAFPTRLIGFTRYFNWAMLMLPLPFAPQLTIEHPERDIGRTTTGAPTAASNSIAGTGVTAGIFASSRSLLNFEQVSSSLNFDLSRPFYAVMFWFVILLAILLVAYTIFALIAWAIMSKKKGEEGKQFKKTYATVLRQKVFYVLTRVILIAYMPINITAAYHLKTSSDGGGGVRAASAICIIVFGILPIIFNAFVVWGKTKELLFLYLKLRFGALYSVYHYEKARFNLVVLARKFLIAILIGFLATNRDNEGIVFAQVFVIIAIMLVYLIILFIVRPYLDQVHLLLDAGITILNAIAWGIALLCIDSSQPAGTFNRGSSASPVAEIIAAICVLLSFAICCVAYCHSWYNLNTFRSALEKPGGAVQDDGDDSDEEGENAVAMKKPKKEESSSSSESSDELASDSEDERPAAPAAAATLPPPPPPADEDSESSSSEPEEASSSEEASGSNEGSDESSESSEEESN